MRFLLALFLMVPAFAQQAPAAADPQAKPAAEQAAKTDDSSGKAKADAEAPAANPVPSTDGWFTGSVDFGYRWRTALNGNSDMYRSVVNLGEGPKLTGLDFTILDPKKRLFDRLDARGYGWGGDPYNTAHVDAKKAGIYDLTFDYRNMAYFNAMPSFANPTAPAGFNEQSFDIHRKNLSADLDLRPGSHIIPYLAFDRNSGYGHGITDWVQDQNDEFAVPTLLRDSTNNYRGGVRFEYNRFHVTLEQGGTTFKDDDQASEKGTHRATGPAPCCGQTLDLSSLQQAYGIRGNSIYSKALVTASPFSWIDVYGQFLYSEPKTTVNYGDVATGNFALLSSLLFYSGQQNLGTGSANQPHTTGSAGFELRPLAAAADRRIVDDGPVSRCGIAVRDRELLRGTTAIPEEVTALNYGQVVNYNQQQIDVIVTTELEAHAARRLPLRVGRRHRAGRVN